MTIPQMSPTYKDPVNSLLKSKQNVVGRNAAGAHYPHCANIRRVLHTTDPSQVSSSVCSPGA